MKPIILFDLDGTLIDSTEAILRSFEDSFKHFDMPVPEDEKVKALIGHPLDYMYTHLGVDPEKVWDFVDVYKSHYRQRSKPMTHFLPDAKAAIQEAATFARLGIVTTKTGEYSRILLEHMGVMEYFEVLIGREDVTHPKPDPEPIMMALEQMEVEDLDNCWMVGDTCMDLISARHAKIKSVGVLCGYGEEVKLRSCGERLQNNTFLAVKYIKNYNKADIKRL